MHRGVTTIGRSVGERMIHLVLLKVIQSGRQQGRLDAVEWRNKPKIWCSGGRNLRIKEKQIWSADSMPPQAVRLGVLLSYLFICIFVVVVVVVVGVLLEIIMMHIGGERVGRGLLREDSVSMFSDGDRRFLLD